jgi:hypothetical protein
MDSAAANDSGYRRLFQSEAPSLAFISSVMTTEFESIRCEVVNAFEQISGVVPWAFEFSPASSENVVDGYLRKVREATFVIWLAGSSTTDPVEAEIGEALSADTRLLAFVLPVEQRDERTQALLDRVGESVRYRKVSDIAEIATEVKAAVADEISRALAGIPSRSKSGRLAVLWRESHARCIQKWQAAGLDSDLAVELSSNPDVGAIPAQFLPGPARPLVVLVGQSGSGKSLACERFIQSALAAADEMAGAPLPVFVQAADVVGNLKAVMVSATDGLGDPEKLGVRIVIDGADEAGDRSSRLLAEARELVRSWSDTQILLSTRPLSAYAEIEEATQMPTLSEEDGRKIVAAGAGRDISVGERAGWPKAVQEAIEIPFFALLVGERLRRNAELPLSRAELLAELAQRSLGSQAADTMILLRRLAVRSIQRGGTLVPLSELGGPVAAGELQISRQVVVEQGGARFPLALTAQWLAAESLAESKPGGSELADNVRDLELWRYPLAMLVGNYSHEQVSAVLGPLTERHPGFVSQVIDESIAKWSRDKESRPPLHEVGARIRDTMPYWLRGLSDLSEFVLEGYDKDARRLPSIGIGQDGPVLAAGWYRGEEEVEDVARLPLELFHSNSETPGDRGWPRIRSVNPSPQAAWAWRWTMQEVANQLRDWLEERSIPVFRTRLENPRVWLAAIAVLGLPRSHRQALPIPRVRERATELLPQADPKLRGYGPFAIDLERLIEAVDRLQGEGIDVVDPAPLEIEPSGQIYVPGSAQSSLRRGRVTDVYQEALEVYEELCSGLFSGLAGFMPIAATLPARLDGHLYARGPGPEVPDSFEWSMFALPHGEPSRAEITITDNGDPELTHRWRESWIQGADEATESLKALRPDQSRWLGMHFSDHIWRGLGHLAVEEVVYDWLWSDLKSLKLVQGLLPEAPYKTIP